MSTTDNNDAPVYHRCRHSFVTGLVGKGHTLVAKDTLVTGDDPRYRANPAAFVPVSEVVEQATAAPGERRTFTPRTGRRRGKAAQQTEPPADEPTGDPGDTNPGDDPQGGSGDGSPPGTEAPAGGDAGGTSD